MTTIRRRIPYTDPGTVKKLEVAPGIAKHEPFCGSAAGHFAHWYENVIGNDPVQVPADAKRRSPTIGTVWPSSSFGSEIDGATLFDGGFTTPACEIAAVAFDSADCVCPAEFVANTTTRSRKPTSACTTA